MIVFWILFAIWAVIEAALFYAAMNCQGQAMPIAPLLFWVGMVSGLVFFLILHIVIRKWF